MPTKHINCETWEKVEKAYMRAIMVNKSPIKQVDFLNLLILQGIKDLEDRKSKVEPK
jgi:hypothetical protein